MKNISTALVFTALLAIASTALATDPLTPSEPICLTGTHGKFDFIKVDAHKRRLLACHGGNGTLDVIDLDSKAVTSIPAGVTQGVAIDEKGERYFVSVSKPPKLVVIDSQTLKVSGEVTLPAAADLVAYHQGLNRVFVANDEKSELWVIDAKSAQLTDTLAIAGSGMEDLDFNPDGDALFLNVKDAGTLVKIDPVKVKVITSWPTAPAEKPHGLLVIHRANGDVAAVAGGSGKLGLFDLATGRLLSSAAIAPKVDELAYDPELNRIYCAAGSGFVTVLDLKDTKLTALATVPSAAGAHSIAVDPKIHTVWIAYAKDDKSFVQAFSAK